MNLTVTLRPYKTMRECQVRMLLGLVIFAMMVMVALSGANALGLVIFAMMVMNVVKQTLGTSCSSMPAQRKI